MKQSQQAVNYRPGGMGQGQCGKCSMYRKAGGQFGSCTAVTGKITTFGVCNLLELLVNPFGPRPHPQRVAYHHNRLNSLMQGALGQRGG